MVKPTPASLPSTTTPEHVSEASTSPKYKGVRKRKWGKWVSEIRLPNSRERIWLGSYDSPKKAARAFDAALFCLRGRDAKFNFPERPPEITGGQSLSPQEIQVVAARFANQEEAEAPPRARNNSSNESHSMSDGVMQVDSAEVIDWSFLSMLDNSEGISDYGFYSGLGNNYMPGEDLCPPPNGPEAAAHDDDNEDFHNGGDAYSHSSFLWNF